MRGDVDRLRRQPRDAGLDARERPDGGGDDSDRSAASAAVDAESVPLPSTGMAMLATVASLSTSTVIGRCSFPLATAPS